MLSKIIGRDMERNSRFHTRRGELTLQGFLPALLRRRRAADGPWMAPRAVARLNRLLTDDMSLLELGSGRSTAWYAARCAHVVSVEPDPAWAAQVRDWVRDMPATVIESSVASFLGGAASMEQLGVVIIDHIDEPGHTRVDSIRATMDRAHVIVLDDSDRLRYRAAEALLGDWRRERYIGFRPRPLQPTETTIWCRP